MSDFITVGNNENGRCVGGVNGEQQGMYGARINVGLQAKSRKGGALMGMDGDYGEHWISGQTNRSDMADEMHMAEVDGQH